MMSRLPPANPRQFFLAEEPLIRFVPVPNPFPISRETAAFHFSLAKEAAAVEIVVYDMMGNPLRKLRDSSTFAPQQEHILSWDGINGPWPNLGHWGLRHRVLCPLG